MNLGFPALFTVTRHIVQYNRYIGMFNYRYDGLFIYSMVGSSPLSTYGVTSASVICHCTTLHIHNYCRLHIKK